MELPKGQLSKKEFWLAHIKAAETFDGTNKEYCKRHGLNLGSFSGYKNKFGFSGRKKANTKPSGFAEVQIGGKPGAIRGGPLPDPKWLAEFLKAWVAES